MNQRVPKLIFLNLSLECLVQAFLHCISTLHFCNVELLRELPRWSSGIIVKVNKELSLGFSAWQSSQHWIEHPPGNLVPAWVNFRLPGAYLCSICVVSVNVVMFCFPHKVPVSWLRAFVHTGQGRQSCVEKAMVELIDLTGEERC